MLYNKSMCFFRWRDCGLRVGRFEPSQKFLAQSVRKLQSYKVFTTVGRVVVVVVEGSYYYSNEAF